MSTFTDKTGGMNPSAVSLAIGTYRSRREGRIILVHVRNGASQPMVVRYDQLNRQDRLFVKTYAQDPLNVLSGLRH